MIDPQQDGLGRYFSILQAVLLGLRNVFSFDVEMKDGLCISECFLYSNASFLPFRSIFPRSFPFQLDTIILIHHPLQIILQVSPNSTGFFISIDQFLVSWHKIALKLLIGQDRAFEPKMAQHLFRSQTFLRICNEQSFNQILERCWKRLQPSLKLAPKHLQPPLSDHIILHIGDLRVLEGRNPYKHQEQHNSSSKHVYLFSFIQQVMDLRGDIPFCSSPRPQEVIIIVALCVPCEPKICYLDIESPIEQDIFELDVTMGDLDVLEVFEGCDKLKEESPTHIL